MTRFYWTLALVLVIAAWVASAILYPGLPARVPLHWDLHGKVDGYGAKGWAVFLMPGVMTGLLVLFAFLPALSPRQFEVDSFRSTYLFVMVLVVGLFAYIHGLMLLAAAARHVGVGRALVGGIFVMFALLGNVLGKVRRNFYIGVRTPWTLASERVWTDTHRLAAWLLVLAGLVGLAITLLGLPLAAAFAVLIVAVLTPVVYSFVRYKGLERRGAF
jgi:uncharacterized membrane protein